jgi:CMP-N-acetylneuraminic acid synthetase
MDESTAVEIDEPEDWERVERLLLRRQMAFLV